MIDPWRCKNGHENRTEISLKDEAGLRRRVTLRCSETGCAETTSIFVGTGLNPPPKRGKRHRKIDAG